MAAALRAFFKGRPLLANCVTYGTLYAAAEFSQQTLIRKALVSKYLAFKVCKLFNDYHFRQKNLKTMICPWWDDMPCSVLRFFLPSYSIGE